MKTLVVRQHSKLLALTEETCSSKKTFKEICDLFPDFVWDLPYGTKADWGTGLFVENHDGFPMIMDTEWDTSD